MKVQTTARLRIKETDSEKIKQYAKRHKSSVSAVIREALEPYLEGQKELPRREPNAKETTFLCYVDDFTKFKALAKTAGVPWDEAVRVAIQEHLQNLQ